MGRGVGMGTGGEGEGGRGIERNSAGAAVQCLSSTEVEKNRPPQIQLDQ